jgi:hypothetical protein
MHVAKKRTLREKWRLTSLSNKTISVATVIIAVASTLQFGTALFQWLEMRDAGIQTAKIIAANERVAAAMEKSAKKSEEALNANIEASRTDQRAWVGFEDVRVTAQIGIPSRFSFNLKNTGKTPALHASLQYYIKNLNRGEKLQFTYKGITTEPTRGLIPPNATVFVNLTNAAPDAAEMNRIRVEEKRVYSYGRVNYADIFGRPHWTTFCTYMARDGSAMTYCPEYNNTDDASESRQ